MKFSSVLSISCVAAAANADQIAFAQCGGKEWKGGTVCVSGYTCTVSNEWYSQCIPAPANSQIATTTAATTLVTSAIPSTTSAPAPVASGFSRAVGRVFEIDGKKQYFAGTNTYYIGFLTNNADIDLIMSHLQTSGLKVLRVWGFNDVTAKPSSGTVWFQSFIKGQDPVINTGADGLQRLDYVVKSAQAHGIKLIINFVNNWDDYGGMKAYNTYYSLTQGGAAWYESAAAQAQYQKYIAAVVSRYKTSPAVFAWELANEPRCKGCDTSVIYNWASKTSAYVKSLDSNHMVTLGDEGFGIAGDTSYPYQFSEGTDFLKNLGIATLDFGTYHMYPGHWSVPESFGPGWIAAHAKAGEAAGKPVVLEEYGTETKTVYPTWHKAVRDTETAGDMYWQYGDTLSYGKTHDDSFALYYGTEQYNSLIVAQAKALAAKPVPA